MKKLFALSASLMFCIILFAGCSSDSSTNPAASGYQIASLADDMRECAPDLALSVINVWASGDNGWSGHVEYGVLKKHFDSSSGSESIYATVLMLDELTSQLASMPAEIFEENGSTTQGDYTVNYSAVTANVTLPSILGSTVITDFERYLNISSTSGYESEMYYKEADGGTEKIYYRYNNTADSERGLVYAERDSSTNNMIVYTACHKAPGDSDDIASVSATHSDNDFRCLLYFEGNTTDQDFKFKVKTDAANGWAFFGGGSVASDTAYIAVRGTDTADSTTMCYENDGSEFTDNSSSSSYVILTFGDMNDSSFDPGGTYPKDGTYTNLDGETASAVSYIDLRDSECLYSSEAEFRSFQYPDSYDQLGF